jgi:spoIIIJ-associated protein
VESQLKLAKQWLEDLLKLMNLPATVSTEEFTKIATDSNSLWLNINTTDLTSEQIASTIGENGENIDAIQYLANTILNLNLDAEAQRSFTIEIDGYRVQRYHELESLVSETVNQVRQTGGEIEVPGLSSAERKQIHTLLQDSADLASESRGQEPNRVLVVKLRDLDSN